MQNALQKTKRIQKIAKKIKFNYMKEAAVKKSPIFQ